MFGAEGGISMGKSRNMTKFRGIAMILRPEYTLFAVMAGIAGMAFGKGGFHASFILPAIVMTLHYMAACVKDDLEDLEVDRRLDRKRPLVVGVLSMHEAYALYVTLHLLALPLSLLVSLRFCVLMALYIPIGIIYAQKPFRVSDRGLLGNIFFAGFTVALPFVGGAVATNSLSLDTVLLTSMLWLWVSTVDALKDFFLVERNIQEDRESFVLTLGVDKASKLYGLMSLLILILGPIPYFAFSLNVFYLVLITCAGIWIFTISALLLSGYAITRQLQLTYFIVPPLIILSVIVGAI